MQEELREKLKEIKQKYGTSLAFIGREIGIHRCTLSLFMNNKRDLAKPVEIKLRNFFKQITQ